MSSADCRISCCRDGYVVRLALLSLLAVFKDLLPGYRIRSVTEEEQEVTQGSSQQPGAHLHLQQRSFDHSKSGI